MDAMHFQVVLETSEESSLIFSSQFARNLPNSRAICQRNRMLYFDYTRDPHLDNSRRLIGIDE